MTSHVNMHRFNERMAMVEECRQQKKEENEAAMREQEQVIFKMIEFNGSVHL